MEQGEHAARLVGSEPALVRRRLRVTGRVQGVWFRATAQQAARQHQVTGWVRNLPDGSVELEAQGPPAGVQAVAEWCEIGPPRAHVLAVDSTELDVVADEADFDVH